MRYISGEYAKLCIIIITNDDGTRRTQLTVLWGMEVISHSIWNFEYVYDRGHILQCVSLTHATRLYEPFCALNLYKRSEKMCQMCTCLLFYLHFRQSTLIANQQQVAAVIDEDLFLETATLWWFLLHVGASQIPMHQRRFARIQRADDAQSQIWYGPRYRPFLAVYKRVWIQRERGMGGKNSNINDIKDI